MFEKAISVLPLGAIDAKQSLKETYLQAKEMEKQQMIDFANDLLAQNNTNYIAIPDLAKQYYTQTYKLK